MPELTWSAIQFLVNLVVTLGLGIAVLGLLVVALYLLRYFNLSNLKSLFSADLPKFNEVSATLNLLGQKLAATATLDSLAVKQIANLEEQVERLDGITEKNTAALALILDHLREENDGK